MTTRPTLKGDDAIAQLREYCDFHERKMNAKACYIADALAGHYSYPGRKVAEYVNHRTEYEWAATQLAAAGKGE